MQLDAGLLPNKLCTKVWGMDPAQIKEILGSLARRRVTATDVADALRVSRNTANSRLADGLPATETIEVSRYLEINPTQALLELGHLTANEVFDFLDGDGTLLASASTEQLVRTLAEDVLPLSDRIELGAAAKALADRRDELAAASTPDATRDELASRRSSTPDVTPTVQPDQIAASDVPPEPEEGDDGYGPGA